jgi:hypothetical protein
MAGKRRAAQTDPALAIGGALFSNFMQEKGTNLAIKAEDTIRFRWRFGKTKHIRTKQP